jgi:nicotinamidase-related amidase
MAANLGFTTFVVSDATASFESTGLDGEHYPAELVQRVSLATLNGEFATVLTAEQLLDRFGLTTGESAKVNH